MRGAGVLFGALLLGCAASPSAPAPAPVVVEPATAATSGAEPPAGEAASPAFSDFARRFRQALTRGDEAWLADLVGPEGVLLTHNPGAFTTIELHVDFASLVQSTPASARLEGYPLRCKPTPAAAPPTFDCEREAWSMDAACVAGATTTTKPLDLIDALAKYELMNAEEREAMVRVAEPLQSQITHFLYDTEEALGFYFGRVDDAFRLLWVDAVTPCSA